MVGDYVAYWHEVYTCYGHSIYGMTQSEMSLETKCMQFCLLETAALYEEYTNFMKIKKNKQFTLFSERKADWQ